MSTRAYRLGKRAEAVDENRARIIDAAYELISAAGFHPVSLEEVAKRAGVTRPTVYRHFGSRSGLFEAVTRDRLQRARLHRLDRARSHPDVVRALRDFLAENCRLFEEIGDALRDTIEAGRRDPEVARLLDLTYYGRRVASITELARRLDDAGKFAPGWTRARVVDALMILTSLEAFDTLTSRRARTRGRAGRLLFEMAQAFLRE